jgi:hypothetical protein
MTEFASYGVSDDGAAVLDWLTMWRIFPQAEMRS